MTRQSGHMSFLEGPSEAMRLRQRLAHSEDCQFSRRIHVSGRRERFKARRPIPATCSPPQSFFYNEMPIAEVLSPDMIRIKDKQLYDVCLLNFSANTKDV